METLESRRLLSAGPGSADLATPAPATELFVPRRPPKPQILSTSTTSTFVPRRPPKPPARPGAPARAEADALSASAARVTWLDQSSNEQGFRIEAAERRRPFKPVATAGANATAVVVPDLKADTPYTFRVSALGNGGSKSPAAVTSGEPLTLELMSAHDPLDTAGWFKFTLPGSSTPTLGEATFSATGTLQAGTDWYYGSNWREAALAQGAITGTITVNDPYTNTSHDWAFGSGPFRVGTGEQLTTEVGATYELPNDTTKRVVLDDQWVSPDRDYDDFYWTLGVEKLKISGDLDMNSDGDTDDAVDGEENYRPGYLAGQQVLTATQDQDFNIIVKDAAPGMLLEFALENGTSHPGRASNMGSETGADIELGSLFITADSEGKAIMNAKNKDFAGTAKIKIKIGGIVAVELDLGKDDDNDGLPNWWEGLHGGNLDANTDEDKNKSGTAGEGAGDKLPTNNEFRGFMVTENGQAKHIRTDPKVKDVFLKNVTGYTTTDAAGDTLAWTANLDLNTHRVADGQHDAQRTINFNGANSQRAIFVEDAALNGYGETFPSPSTPSTYESVRVDIARHKRTVTVMKTIAAAGGNKHVLYTPDSDQDPLVSWQDGGKVGLGTNELTYAKGYPAALKGFGLQTTTVDVTAGTTALLTNKIGSVTDPFMGLVGDELIKLEKSTLGGSGTIKALNANGEIELSAFADEVEFPNSGYILAKVTKGADSEWISYSAGRQDAAGKVFLTVHERGLFGTNELAIADGDSLAIPKQYYDVERGALGTQAAAIAANTNIDAVGVLTDVQVGAVNVQAEDKLRYFANVDDAIRNVVAHEVGHAVGLDHLGNLLMQDGKKRGSFLHHGFEDHYDQQQMDVDLDAR